LFFLLSIILCTSTFSAAAETNGTIVVSDDNKTGVVQNNGTWDVILDVPDLSIENITIEVENLDAHITLDAQVGTLVQLTVGAAASIQKVKINIVGVEAKGVSLKVNLAKVADIIDRALESLDKNPNLLNGLVASVGNLLSKTVDSVGNLVSQTVDSLGHVIKTVTDAAGNLLSSVDLGSVLDQGYPLVGSFNNTAGDLVTQLSPTPSSLIQVTQNATGSIIDTKIFEEAR